MKALKSIVVLLCAGVMTSGFAKEPAKKVAVPQTVMLLNLTKTPFQFDYNSWKGQARSTKEGIYVAGKADGKGGVGANGKLPNLDGCKYLDVGAAVGNRNKVPSFHFVLNDADGTSEYWSINVSQIAPSHPVWFQVPIDGGSVTKKGSKPGLDLAHLTGWQFQGDWQTEKQFHMVFIAVQGVR